MIVQTAPVGAPHFIIMQTDHTKTCGQFIEAFGNHLFERTAPHDLMVYVVTHHDAGWRAVDALQTLDTRTGLPYHLTQTPTAQLVATGNASPDFNEAHHLFCGVISSMHTYGLYHGRYGLSDKIYIDSITPELRPQVDAMLIHEVERQGRLKALLRANPETAGWATDEMLFHHYKRLQFFDTLALYIQMTYFDALVPTTFANVPRALGDDVQVHAQPIAPNTVRLTPYPFAEDGLEVTTEGRYLSKFEDASADWRVVYHQQPHTQQTVRFVAG